LKGENNHDVWRHFHVRVYGDSHGTGHWPAGCTDRCPDLGFDPQREPIYTLTYSGSKDCLEPCLSALRNSFAGGLVPLSSVWRSGLKGILVISKLHKYLLLLSLSILLLAALPACSSQTESNPNMMSLGQMPSDVRAAPAVVQQAYRYAAANPDVMNQVPCYCGCGAAGHTSNYSCYVQSVDANGKITFDKHALGCSLCVDITQDVIRLRREGKSIPEIRSYVDSTYSKYGPSNMQ